MSKILVYTSPARGHLYPLIPTLQELRRRGHQVSVRTLASEVDRLRALGLSAAPIDPAIEAREMNDWKAGSPPAALLAHGPLLAQAACVVCHGGMGITQKALAAGVPVCVVPFGRDQLEVARHVEVAGAGTRVPSKRLTAERLRRAVREAMALAPGARRWPTASAAREVRRPPPPWSRSCCPRSQRERPERSR